MKKILAYIRLMRPANILTALADILLGFAASGAAIEILKVDADYWALPLAINLYLLLFSSSCLYAGGVVLNDLFDFELDKSERPERPLPSGQASPEGASVLGILLSFCGIGIAISVSILSGLIATLIVCLSLLYNKYSKHHSFWGPLNMAGCRAANLLLGMSIIEEFTNEGLILLIVPLLYIASITLLSKGEVNGTEKKSIESSLLLFVLLLIFILNLSLIDRFSLLYSFPFLILFVLFSLPGFIYAIKKPEEPFVIRRAVRNAILGLILLDSALVAGFAGIYFGLLVMLLLPLSIILAKTFAVS